MGRMSLFPFRSALVLSYKKTLPEFLSVLPVSNNSPSLPSYFCAHLTFHHSLSCPISHFPPRFPYAFPTALCPFWHICCLGTGFERLPLVRLPCWRYRWKRLILFFLKSPRTLQSDYFHILLHVTCRVYKLIESTYGQQNQLSTPVVFYCP
jgi:hypothetical protein